MMEPQRFEQSGEIVLVERIAAGIRAELGTAIEVCPGHASPEHAEPLNRAFRAVVRCVLEPVAIAQDDLPRLVSHILRRIVVRRLEAGGLGERATQTLLDFEPGTPDDWLTFLLLVPWAEVLFWLTYEDPESV
jgi:hypothetical protein